MHKLILVAVVAAALSACEDDDYRPVPSNNVAASSNETADEPKLSDEAPIEQ